MATEDHPLLKQFAERTTLGETRDDIHRQASLEFALAHHDVRADALKKLNEKISADDGVGLRQKSQLLGLRRELSTLHHQLRRTGR